MSYKERINELRGIERRLSFLDRNLYNEDLKSISKALKDTQFTELDISHNWIDDKGIEYLTRVLKYTQITSLNLRLNIITVKSIKYLAPVLKDTQITTLHLGNNSIRDEGIKYLTTFLKDTKITSLNVSDNGITDVGINYLARVLKYTSINNLDLSCNYVRDGGPYNLAEVLKYTLITSLDLSQNCITYEGAKHIVEVMKETQITSLNLSNNQLTEEGAKHLIEVLIDTEISNTKFVSKICKSFKELVFLNPLTNNYEFVLPKEYLNSTMDVLFDQYLFLIRALNGNERVTTYIFHMFSIDRNNFIYYLRMKIISFITKITDKFNSFINNNILDLLKLFSSYNYVHLVQQFEEIGCCDIVENFLLHRELFYIDENNEILHPYIYKMLSQHNMPLYNKDLEPNKKEDIISYFKNHPEIGGMQEITDLLQDHDLCSKIDNKIDMTN